MEKKIRKSEDQAESSFSCCGYKRPGFAHHLNKQTLSSVNWLLEVAARRPRNFSPSTLLQNMDRPSSLVSH